MAYGAVGRESRGRMRRIVGGIEIGHMTRGALSVGTGQLVIVVRVALLTGDGGMETGENPSGTGVIERATSPIGGVMALLARLGESRLNVVGVGGGLRIFRVAGCAGGMRVS